MRVEWSVPGVVTRWGLTRRFPAGVLLVLLLLNYPLHLLYVRCTHGAIRRMGTNLRSAM